jgi:UDP-N-acetylmuramoylalanine--D-glutamate ligase
MKTPEIKGKSVLILGYGREGKSIHRWLMAHYPGIQVGIADRRVKTELMSGEVYKGATVYNGEGYLFHLHEYDTVVRSPGISPYLPEVDAFVKKGGHITSATNIFFSLVRGTTIGITGTKGKSTTSSLIAHILSSTYQDVRLAGNIGEPMLDTLDTADERTVFVLELSSHQLFDCRYSPHIAVMLGIVSEHLDYYPNFLSYANAKGNITKHQRPGDYFVYNPLHTFVREIAKSTAAIPVRFGVEKSAELQAYIQRGVVTVNTNDVESPIMNLVDVPLLGNVENVLAAVTVAHLMNVPVVSIASAITPFRSLPHRLEYVGEYKGVRFYNDSLATIPQATVHAIEALGPDVVTLLVGGYDRNLDFTELGAYIRSHFIPTLILFPDTGKKIWEAIGDVQSDYTIQKFDVTSMEEAVRLAYKHTPRGKICLLSPASASYNMFKDYEDRGNQFKALVKKLGVTR